MKHKFGLVLSGGGARGLAHIGLLKALTEWNIKPDVISGTSAGATIGVLFATGLSPDEIGTFLGKTNFFHFTDLSFKGQGLLSMKSNEKILRTMLGKKTFNDLSIPVYVTATDLLEGKAIHISSGDLVLPLLASAALPSIFEPVRIEDRLLSDGAALCCLPIEPVINSCDAIVGMYVNPVGPLSTIKGVSTTFDRSYHLTLYREVTEKKDQFDLLLEPKELLNYGLFDFKKSKEIIAIGYDHAQKNKRKIFSLLSP